MAYYNCKSRNVRKLFTPKVQCISITDLVLSIFDGFTSFHNYMSWNVRKLGFLRIKCTSITNRVLSLFGLFFGLLHFYELKCQKTHNTTSSVHKYHKSWSYLISYFSAYYNCMRWSIRKPITPRVQYKRSTNRVLSLFDRFRAHYNYMSRNVRKLINPWVHCTSITNRVVSLFDCFTPS